MQQPDIVILGPIGNTHISGSLCRAARRLGLACRQRDTKEAFSGPWLARALVWHLAGKRPLRLNTFSRALCLELLTRRPRGLIAVGHAPIRREEILALRGAGVHCVNYSTDDPWNLAHRATWHLDALTAYDIVFTPRKANIEDMKRLGCKEICYLPFGYDEDLFRDASSSESGISDPIDILFVGGADDDRAKFATDFIREGLRPALIGGYWDRHSHLRDCSLGIRTGEEVRALTARAGVNICLVRRANRDGHVMRSFEIPACGGFMLAEDTAEHREIFGDEGIAVLYFRDAQEAARKARWALGNPDERQRMAREAHRLVTSGGHSYRHRLQSMLDAKPLLV